MTNKERNRQKKTQNDINNRQTEEKTHRKKVCNIKQKQNLYQKTTAKPLPPQTTTVFIDIFIFIYSIYQIYAQCPWYLY